MSRLVSIAIAIAIATAIAFADVRNAEFLLYDDDDYVTHNAWVQGGLSIDSLRWAATSLHVSNWHPLTWLSHMLDAELFGLEPTGHHVTSLLLHIANAVLLFLLWERLTGALWRSALVAALFALHPAHVESVAWIAERKDVLSGLFWVLTVGAYAAWVRTRRPGIYALALALCALGLMAKSMLMTLPFVLLLFDFWPLRRTESLARVLWEKVPFVALAVGAGVLALVTQSRTGALVPIDAIPLDERIGNAVVAYARYLGKLSWPVDLAIYYPHPGHWPLHIVAAAAGLLAALSAIAVWQWRRRPFLLFGWLFFCVTLVPVVGLVQVGSQSLADRYTYVPSIGLFVALAWGMASLAERAEALRRPVFAAATALVLVFAVSTQRYVSRWHDTETIFTHALEVTNQNGVAHHVLGYAHFVAGDVDEAIAQYEKALALRRADPRLHVNTGKALLVRGDLNAAVHHLERAVALRPEQRGAQAALGGALLRSGELERAEVALRAALRQQPRHAQAWTDLGIALERSGRAAEARDHYNAMLQVAPNDLRVRWPLLRLLAAHPDPDVRDASRAVSLGEAACPAATCADANDLDLLAMAYAEASRFPDAIAAAERALDAARGADVPAHVSSIEVRLALYRAQQPFRFRLDRSGSPSSE